MARIAFGLPALPSHAAIHAVLARELMRRGHDCTFVGEEGLAAPSTREGVAFRSLNTREQSLLRAGLIRTLIATAASTRAFVRHGPQVLADLASDLVIADQGEPGASLAADACGIRRATLAVALPLDRHPTIPPPFVGWPHLAGAAGERRNLGGWRVADLLMTMQGRALAEGCRRHGLPLRIRIDDWISPDLDLRQLVPELDFPHPLAPGAAPVGPLRAPEDAEFHNDCDGRPLIFASLGTLQGGRWGLLADIAGACADLGVRVALAHGGKLTAAQERALPGAPLVQAFFPQRAVLAQSAACITHAGMNTVLDCVAAGVPMLAIPLAFEQPATAARIAYHGIGERITHRPSRASIRQALDRVLSQQSFRSALHEPSRALAQAGGVARAADLIESMLAPQNRMATQT